MEQPKTTLVESSAKRIISISNKLAKGTGWFGLGIAGIIVGIIALGLIMSIVYIIYLAGESLKSPIPAEFESTEWWGILIGGFLIIFISIIVIIAASSSVVNLINKTREQAKQVSSNKLGTGIYSNIILLIVSIVFICVSYAPIIALISFAATTEDFHQDENYASFWVLIVFLLIILTSFLIGSAIGVSDLKKKITEWKEKIRLKIAARKLRAFGKRRRRR